MSRWSRHREIVRGGEAARLAQLAREGQTVELSAIAAGDRVIVIALGFGDEFWRVRDGYQANPFETRVDGGQLIVVNGARLADPAKLAFLTGPIERVVYAV